MNRYKVFLVALVAVLFSGCGALADRRANSFIESVPTSTRAALLEERKPVKTIENAIGFTIDCFDALVVCSDPDGRVVKTIEVPKISQREIYSMLAGHVLDGELYLAAFNASLDPDVPVEMHDWITDVLISYREQLFLVADYAHRCAELSEMEMSSALTSGIASTYALAAPQSPPQQVINVYPSDSGGNVIYTSPSRSAQIGSGFGYGMSIGIAQGAAQAQARRAMQERNEFLALERRALRLAEMYPRIVSE